MTSDPRNRLRLEFHEEVVDIIGSLGWHWFWYHVMLWPPHPFMQSIIEACIDIEMRAPSIGRWLLTDLSRIGSHEKNEDDYDQLLQKLAEILLIRQILGAPWPTIESVQYEPAASQGGRRPELKVTSAGMPYLFEVKAPSLLRHQKLRAANGAQLPGRALSLDGVEVIKEVWSEKGVTLPRDNPVKDFLLSAEAKFAPFKQRGPCHSTLVIVWDDFIYEPITSLLHERCGLLTPNSFARNEHGPLRFPSIDDIVIIRHLHYFKIAAADAPLADRDHALDFGDSNALPNVYMPLSGGAQLPEFLLTHLRALHHDSETLQRAADYRSSDLVMWV